MDLLSHNAALLGTQCRERFFSINEALDVVVTDDPVHIGYLSGYRSALQDMPPYPQALIATRSGIALVTGASDGAAALEVLGDPASIWRHGTFFVFGSGSGPTYADMPPASKTFAQALEAALHSFSLKNSRIGVDLSRPELRGALEAACPDARLVSTADEFRRARAIKLKGEIDILRHVSQITDRAIGRVSEMMRPGVTELDIAAEIARDITLGGGVARFIVVTSGERSSRVDAYARPKRLQEGDLVRLDIGATVNGYYSDMARTYAVGDPGALAKDRYQALLLGEKAEFDTVKAGVAASEVFESAMRVVRSSGLPGYERNHCGHGIGLKAHEFPLLGPGSETILQAGMVLCVETPYYELGWGGMMVEDTLLVTDSGYELLTETSRELCK